MPPMLVTSPISPEFSSNACYKPEKPKYYKAYKASSLIRACSLRLSDLHDGVFSNRQPYLSLPAPVSSPTSSKLAFPYTSSILFSRLPSASVWHIQLPETPAFWLSLYFLFNLTLTLYNKSVLIQFPFPYTLTALHALCGTIGTFVILRLERGSGRFRLPRVCAHSPVPVLHGREKVVLFMFSVLYTINIAISNVSLRLVTVPVSYIHRDSESPSF